ncbi:transcription-repair coupling factor [Parasphingorhabdus halotolerans]|uniref:Transcription-repair-coupling factor n=1 Tax=Parasphingorhabdus halotolerans TaxID=2725558 RepID=A0A6H2DJ50_9SPHN|nr:transcription-repair coupling factor [Parasphingorhabdus halotolerans]QJB68167.1 transcription-repair coupling factor [Parasphingorhabdus halotolerans]
MSYLDKLLSSRDGKTLAGIAAGYRPYCLADIAVQSGKRTVYIATDDAAMSAIAEVAHYFQPGLEIIEFPAWDCLPYDRASPALHTTSDRLAALAKLAQSPNQSQLVVTTVNAVTQRVLEPSRVKEMVTRLAPGTIIKQEKLVSFLYANGFVRVDTVADSGEFAARGGLIDLFPPGAKTPLRIDLFGDEIETLRKFDPNDQRTIGNIDGFELLPVSEFLLDEASITRFRIRYRDLFGAVSTSDPLYQSISEGRRLAGMEHWLPLIEERLVTLFDYLDDNTIILRDAAASSAAEAQFLSVADYYKNRLEADKANISSYRPLDPKSLYLDSSEWIEQQNEAPIHVISEFDEPESYSVIPLSVSSPRDFSPERARNENIYKALATHLNSLSKSGTTAIVASYSKGSRARLYDLLTDHDVKTAVLCDDWKSCLAAESSVALTVLPLSSGFRTDDIALLTEQDIFGDRLVRKSRRRKSSDAFIEELSALNQGDLVVHLEHGIGLYEGIVSIPVGESPHDCVHLKYAGGDKLYVPVENIDVLSRYGDGGDSVVLDRLGGEGWQRRKSKLKERIRAIAHELLKTAAARALQPATSARVEPQEMAGFVDRFPYQETDDQQQAIEEVLGDMASGKAMDRLVCGDVGFGKTEVAMRAAFAAAMAGMQVAIIAPTTLLARQHFSNFEERFRPFPLKIGRLSRLVPQAEAKKTREGLTTGDVDIVIGTHALISKSIEFQRLGLIIIDEEQRFGVTHKERLKAMKSDVHVLTLTATPIPRTLQMAMTGLRELSVIQTPPVDRLAVRTYVMPWDPVPLQEALMREHYRGGQSFIVVPRIADLPDIEEFLKNYAPEITYVVAHGQMPPTTVEERMSAFYDRKYDVLLATTIVESGLDIPSANTLIIHRADRFGLAQLYQLRGRVGRSKTRAYAYMVTPKDRIITEKAEKRLKILGDLDNLGAGFELASHDLDIRGAGNLLGDEQSGHIREVGFELYQSMLEDAILEAKAKGAGLEADTDGFSPQITVDAPIMIPENYVPDLSLRMGLYRRMNSLKTNQEIQSFAAEMIDRFGDLPIQTDNLLKLMQIKMNCVQAHISKIEMGPRGALVSFHKDKFPNVLGLLAYVERLKGTAKIRPDNKLFIERKWRDPKSRLHGLTQLSTGLSKLAQQNAS